MIQYIIFIIIIIICIELYIRYYKDTSTKSDKSIKSINIWDKVITINNKKKYYIKINNLDQDKFIEWKKNIGEIDYDVTNKYIIVKNKTEEGALAIVNLFIVYLNGDIELDYIIENDLINRSRMKATTYKMVRIKLIELIKEGIDRLDNNNIDTIISNHFDTNDDKEIESSDIIQSILNKVDSQETQSSFSSTTSAQNNKLNSTTSSNTTKQIEALQNSINEDILTNIPLENKQLNISPYGGPEYAFI